MNTISNVFVSAPNWDKYYRTPRTVVYDFRLKDGVWCDINHPVNHSLRTLFCDILGVPIPSDVTSYCIIDTERWNIKYRRSCGCIKVYLTPRYYVH